MFSLQDAIDTARAIIEGHENHVYQPPDGRTCRYADDNGKPSCIVGQIVFKLSPETFTEAVYREQANGSFFADNFCAGQRYGRSELVIFEHTAAEFLSALQGQQDAGIMWGKALRHALREVNGENA